MTAERQLAEPIGSPRSEAGPVSAPSILVQVVGQLGEPRESIDVLGETTYARMRGEQLRVSVCAGRY